MRSGPGPDLQPPPEVAVPGAERNLVRDWRSVLLAPVGDGRRRRRGTDGMRLAAAVVALVCCLLVIHYDSRIDRAIVAVIHPPPWSITWLVTVVYQAGSFGVVIVLVGLALLARRWEIARDIGLSAVGAAAVTGLLVLWLGNHGGRPSGVVIGDYNLSFPVLRIALFAAVATAALPYLSRGLQVLTEIFIALVALASAVGGHGLPLNIVGSLVIGWGTTAVVRLAFGSPLGLPSPDDVRRLLAEFGVRVGHLQPMPQQAWGAAKYEATDTAPGDSSPRLAIAVYGRDAADARLLTKAGRFLLYRDSGPTLTLTRLQQVQREAFFTLRAGQAGVAVPELVEAGTAGPSKDAVLVYRLPSTISLAEAGPDDVGDGALDDIDRQLLILRKARIAHGAISGDALLIDPAGQTAVLADFRNATGSALVDQLDQDLAGPGRHGRDGRCERGWRRRGPMPRTGGARGCAPAPAQAVPRPGHREAPAKTTAGCWTKFAEQAARSASIELPELAQPRRVSWPTLILIIGTLIGGWALIGVLIDVSKSFDTVIGADWLWVIIALVLAQLAYVSSAVETLGSVSGPLPFGRALAVEVANAFSGLAVARPRSSPPGCASTRNKATTRRSR